MTTVAALLDVKGHAIVSVGAQASVLDAVRLMADNGLGAVLVRNGEEVLGIFTERDVLRRIVAQGVDPAVTPVSAVMTAAVVTCLPATTLDECGAIMTSREIRHLLVADSQGLHGIISSRDVLAHRTAEQETTIRFLNEYMFSARG